MTHDYTRKGGIVHAEIMLPAHAPPEFADRSTLWNSVEQIEKARDSQLAREIEAALPRELSREQQLALVRAYVKDNFVDKGMCADFAIHDKGTGNPHVHIMLTVRPLKENGAWGAKCRKAYDLDENGQRIPDGKGGWKNHREDTTDWNDKENVEIWRAAWAAYTNRALESAGRPERIDHRSYKRQGIDKIPSVHLGPAASQMYYYEHYGGHVEAQNARNEKTRHTERNRTVEDLLKNNKTCPEESIYQIGTMGESVPPDTLFSIVNEFYEEFERRFGSHIHILDWALHLDEGTPHIHERHVFDCENRYGELCPQQEKALEELGIPLPNPEKPKGRNNNRKQTFDAVCRTILFDIARRHGLHLDQEPSYGGRDYLEKQDYILMKQKEQLAAQEQKLEELTLKIEDVETLLDDVSDAAYDKAVEVVTDTVRQETHKEDIRLVEETKKWVLSPERKAPQKERDYAAARLDGVITKIKRVMQNALAKIQKTLMQPEVKKAGKEQIKEKARESIREKLAKGKANADRKNRERWEREGRIAPTKKKDMEL